MENMLNQKNIKNSILEKIKNKNIKKIPKIFFNLKGFLFALAIIIFFSLLLFLVSFIFFTLKVSGLWYLPIFGWKGVGLLIKNFPWILILLIFIFIIIIEILIRRYRVSYRRPVLYSVLFLILILTIMSFLVWKTSLQESIYQNSKDNRFVQDFYKTYLNPAPDQFHPGTVVEVNSEGFIIEQRDKSRINVKILKNTKIRPGFKIYKGGRLLIIGKIKNGVIEAESIENAPISGRP